MSIFRSQQKIRSSSWTKNMKNTREILLHLDLADHWWVHSGVTS
jgi:hypothetical protein